MPHLPARNENTVTQAADLLFQQQIVEFVLLSQISRPKGVLRENIDGDAFAPFQQGRVQDDGIADLLASFESRIQ